MTCSSVDLPEPGRPDDRHQLAAPHGEGHPAQRGHGRLLAVDLGHRVELEDRVAHSDGTATRSPARRSPSTCTRPAAVSNRPTRTATRSRRSPARTTSTAKPPPDLPTSAVTGTLSALAHPRGGDVHRDRSLVEPARLARVVEADVGGDGRVGGAGALRGRGLGDAAEPVDLPRHRRVARQRDLRAIAPLDLALIGRIEAHLHVQRVGGGVQRLGARPRRSAELAADLRDPHRFGQEDRVAEGERAGHVHALAALERLRARLASSR